MQACCYGAISGETERGRRRCCRWLWQPTTSSACRLIRPEQHSPGWAETRSPGWPVRQYRRLGADRVGRWAGPRGSARRATAVIAVAVGVRAGASVTSSETAGQDEQQTRSAARHNGVLAVHRHDSGERDIPTRTGAAFGKSRQAAHARPKRHWPPCRFSRAPRRAPGLCPASRARRGCR